MNNIQVIDGVRYILTNHVRDRYQNRFSAGGPNITRGALLDELINELKQSKENHRVFNDTEFISYIYDRYGTEHRVKFMQSGDVIFICKQHDKRSDCFIVTTCYSPSSYGGGNRHLRRGTELNSKKRKQ